MLLLGGLHTLAVVIALHNAPPDFPRRLTRAALSLGLCFFTVAAVLGRVTGSTDNGSLSCALGALHLAGQAGIAALVLAQVIAVRDRLLLIRIGLDAISTSVGLTAALSMTVLAATGTGHADPPTLVVLALTGVDILLLATALALASVLHAVRSSPVPPLLIGCVLLLGADLADGYVAQFGGQMAAAAAFLLHAAACLRIAGAIDRPVVIGKALRIDDRLAIWSSVPPFACTGASLIAILIAARVPSAQSWVTLLVLAAGICLVAVAARFLLTIQVARSMLARLQEATTDPLTGLLNRRGLHHRLSRWVAAGHRVTLLAIDINGFRRINEEAGRSIGDRVLRRVAELLAATAGADAMAARIDGDDFALAYLGEDPVRAALLASAIRARLGRPFDLDGHRLHLTVNVGTTVSHELAGRAGEVPTTDDLLRCADQALAEAQASTSGMAVHDPARCGRAEEAGLLTWVDDLHAALATHDQLLLHFQPQHRIVETGTGTVATVVGCEALLRWAHPTRGLLGPGEVLRAAEHGHLANAVTERVLDLALGGAAGWWADREVPVAVNLSATDLDDELLPHRIADALDRHGLPPRALTVEVVEDTLMLDPDRALQTLTALRSIGLRIAVDDYGTGYSSLAYLHKLPIDEVKFDRSLTAGISHDAAAAVIVGHSIRLAHDLGLSALAEGIEETADLQLLHRLGCDAVQGWLTGYPIGLSEWIISLSPGQDTDRARAQF